MEQPLMITSSPHLHSGESTRTIMLDVLIAMIPAAVMSVWLFGWRAAVVELICVASCIAAEYLSCLVMKKPSSVGDLSCMVTGLLLAFNLPVTIPLWQAALGGVVAIVVAKQMFGGLGQNFVNPALLGRIVLMSSFADSMNNWVMPRAVDAVSSATPLALMAGGDTATYTAQELLLGLRPGCLGETCALALLMGGVYLVVRRVITPLVPLTYIGTVFVLTWMLGENPVYHILSGGLMLGAIFMATDYVTSPVTKAGKAVFAVGCGLLTVLIRLWGSLPEGVSFAILLMNILTPLIERVTKPVPFGQKRGGVVRRDLKSILAAALTLTVIAAVTTALLAGTNALTRDTIAQRIEEIANQTRLQVLDADTFEEAAVQVDGAEVVYYKGLKGDQPVGYVFTVTTSGKSAGLTVMTGVDMTGQVTGVAVTEQNETAGYVEKVEKGGLLSAVIGRTSVEDVDTVSQATKTSKGILRGVEGALKTYQAIAGGAEHE